MNTQQLKECLNKAKREQLGIPVVFDSLGPYLQDILVWALEGTPQEARQIWFGVQDAAGIRSQLPEQVHSRILPMNIECVEQWLKRGPFDALLLPNHGVLYENPNLSLSPFWSKRGAYKRCAEFQTEGDTWRLWFWTSV